MNTYIYCKNLLHQQLLPPGGEIVQLNYYEQMILTLWQYLHFLLLVFPDSFFLFRVCRFVYGILIFSRNIHITYGVKSFMKLYLNCFMIFFCNFFVLLENWTAADLKLDAQKIRKIQTSHFITPKTRNS